MSTRSYISKELPNGRYFGIYCHNDGYLNGVGKTLCKHYTDEIKVDSLIALGDISSLGVEVVPTDNKTKDFSKFCFAYARDNGENYETVKPRFISLRSAKNSGIKFMYIFGLDGKWRYYNLWQQRLQVRDVSEDLQKERQAEM